MEHDCKVGARIPKTNSDYWRKKIERNRERAAASETRLAEAGWHVLVIWECELRQRDAAIGKIVAVLSLNNAQSDEAKP